MTLEGVMLASPWCPAWLFSTMTVEDNLVLGGFRQMRLGQRQWRAH